MLQDGTYMTDDEFLSNFHMDRSCVMQLNRMAEDDQVFRSVSGKIGRQSSGSYHGIAELLCCGVRSGR